MQRSLFASYYTTESEPDLFDDLCEVLEDDLEE